MKSYKLANKIEERKVSQLTKFKRTSWFSLFSVFEIIILYTSLEFSHNNNI